MATNLKELIAIIPLLFKPAPKNKEDVLNRAEYFIKKKMFDQASTVLSAHKNMFKNDVADNVQAFKYHQVCLIGQLQKECDEAHDLLFNKKYEKALIKYKEISEVIKNRLEALQIDESDYKILFTQLLEIMEAAAKRLGVSMEAFPLSELVSLRASLQNEFDLKYGKDIRGSVFAILIDSEISKMIIPSFMANKS